MRECPDPATVGTPAANDFTCAIHDKHMIVAAPTAAAFVTPDVLSQSRRVHYSRMLREPWIQLLRAWASFCNVPTTWRVPWLLA